MDLNGKSTETAVFMDYTKRGREMSFADASRKISSGTLNRLILVAQALESEVDTRRKTEIHGGKIVFAIRSANIVVLCLVNGLLFSGLGQYQDERGHTSLVLSPDKWVYSSASSLPASFNEMSLSGQFLAAALTLILLGSALIVQLLALCRIGNPRMMSMMLCLSSVPCTLVVFGLQMHFSACPWLDDYYRLGLMGARKREYRPTERDLFDPQCGINGWALAGIFSLLSCALFVSEGLTTSFFRSATSSWRARRHTFTTL